MYQENLIVGALNVPTDARNIPSLVGQTFLNNLNAMMLVMERLVRIFDAAADITKHLDLPKL